jgi:beta-N-acetylhexosaminidase
VRYLIIVLISFSSLFAIDIDSLYDSMTPAQRIGQLLMPRVNAAYVSDAHPTRQYWRSLIDSFHVGGIAVYRGDVYEQFETAAFFQEQSSLPLLVGADFENGTGSIYNHGTHFITAMGIGATHAPQNAYTVGQITAREARALGVNMIFAPVADVNTNSNNLIINYRAFGDRPDFVGPFVSAFIRGVQSESVIAVAKHFPGHGDVDRDSHIDFVVQRKGQAVWAQTEKPTFDDAINAGVDAFMTAHIAFPSLSGSDRPATLTPGILQNILRKDMAFTGLILTDAMDMGGIVNGFWSGEAALLALKAGADIVLLPQDVRATSRYLQQCLQNGQLDSVVVATAVKRILQKKQKMNLWGYQMQRRNITARVYTAANLAQADAISAKGITYLSRTGKANRPDPSKRTAVVVISNGNSGVNALSVFTTSMRKVYRNSRFFAIDNRTVASGEWLQTIASFPQVVIAARIPIQAFSGTASFHPEQQASLESLLALRPQSTLVVFGNPYLLKTLPNANNAWLTYTYSKLMQRLVVDALSGQRPVSGRLPVDINEQFAFGDGLQLPIPATAHFNVDGVDSLLTKAIADSVFPGCQVNIGNASGVLQNSAFGFETYARNRRVGLSDKYDLASMTKVVATTLLYMKMYEERLFQMDFTLGQFYPDCPADKKDISLLQLLTHTSGFEPWVPFYQNPQMHGNIIASILTTPLQSVPRTKHKYSDLNFILLHDIAEKLTGRLFADAVNAKIFRPLGLEGQIVFNPSDQNACIATERDDTFNRGIVRGVVQDRNAWMMGGISGHAGLFANAEALGKIARLMLNRGRLGKVNLFEKETVELFAERVFTEKHWTHALGWDTPSYRGSSVGDVFSRRSIGHWGYAGTSIWIDMEHNYYVVLLTNRTWPDRENKTIRKFRPLFHDHVAKTILQKSQ